MTTGCLLLDKLMWRAQNLLPSGVSASPLSLAGLSQLYPPFDTVLETNADRPRVTPGGFSAIRIGRRWHMVGILQNAWQEDDGQDIAEYAVMLAVILVLVVGTIRLIGSNANNVFSSVASVVQ